MTCPSHHTGNQQDNSGLYPYNKRPTREQEVALSRVWTTKKWIVSGTDKLTQSHTGVTNTHTHK